MAYKISDRESTAKGRVAEGSEATTFTQRYIMANKQEQKTDKKGNTSWVEVTDEKGDPIPTGDWTPASAAEAFSYYMDIFPGEQKAMDDILFLINRRFYFDDQPGADPVDRAAKKLAKDLGLPVEQVSALLAGLKKTA